MIPPPAKIDGAHVREFAWSDAPFGYMLDENGTRADAIHGLAICTYPDSDAVYRFSCNKNWETVQDASYDSVQNAKEQLPQQYRAVDATWRTYDYAAKDLRRGIPKNHAFYLTSMPSSRQADYYLGCHGGSVFIDFNKGNDSCVRLVRISFDGYGCCRLPMDARPLSADDSKSFVHQMDVGISDQGTMAGIVSRAITNNLEYLWRDALTEYEFIP